VREDAVLVEALAHLELGDRVPPELYQAVAEALAWAYHLTRRTN
jgi:type III secretion system FlhB-like substrate exporter